MIYVPNMIRSLSLNSYSSCTLPPNKHRMILPVTRMTQTQLRPSLTLKDTTTSILIVGHIPRKSSLLSDSRVAMVSMSPPYINAYSFPRMDPRQRSWRSARWSSTAVPRTPHSIAPCCCSRYSFLRHTYRKILRGYQMKQNERPRSHSSMDMISDTQTIPYIPRI